MSKTTRFQKIQLLLSIIPFYSTFFVFVATIVALKRKKVTWKAWCVCFLIMAIAVLIYSGVSVHVSFGEYPFWNVLIATLVFAVANFALVYLQVLSKTRDTSIDMKKFMRISVIASFAIGFVLAVIILLSRLINPEFTHLEDLNGADTSLAVITMEEISTTRNAGRSSMGGEAHEGESSLVEDEYAIFDYDIFRLNWKKMSGVFALQSTKVQEDTLTLTVNTTLTAGNAEIIIFIDDQYYQHIPIGRNQKIVLEDISEKTVVVKLAAESAEIELSINREY